MPQVAVPSVFTIDLNVFASDDFSLHRTIDPEGIDNLLYLII